MTVWEGLRRLSFEPLQSAGDKQADFLVLSLPNADDFYDFNFTGEQAVNNAVFFLAYIKFINSTFAHV